jgi:formylglycine-generating enzyme required for sulfatase activity/acetyl esterase/lipase
LIHVTNKVSQWTQKSLILQRMTTSRVSALAVGCFLTVAFSGRPALTTVEGPALSSHLNIRLWEDGKVPMAAGNGPLDSPFLTAFLPPAGKSNGSSVIIAPGGANIMLMYGAEGLDIAERYNDWGTTAFILTYRLSPRYNEAARVLDGKRAIQIVRANAKAWNLDPNRIGYIGFSAGSNMGRSVTAAATPGDPNASDPIDRVSSRPDYLALVYGAGRATPGESLKDFPPTFLVSAAGDQGPSLGNAQLFADLTRAGAVAEIHVYQKGRHGFGSGVGSAEFSEWMPALEHFLKLGGLLPAKTSTTTAPGTENGASSGTTGSAKPAGASAGATPAAAKAAKTVSDGYGDYVYVPAGAFRMGDTFGEGMSRERPVHTVEVDAFYIAKYEITNGDWKKFRDDPGYDDPKFWPEGRVVPKDQVPYWSQPNNHGGGTPDSDTYPLLGVNWDAAVAYCHWVSAKTGKRYRLPTEAEWEKAARGTDQRRYPWGNTIDRSYANYVGAQPYDTGMPVGSYAGGTRGDLQTKDNASPYGAYDMAGNVMEWTQDWYDRDYYAVSPRKNPKGPATGAYRVVRGGTFFVEPYELRSAARSAAWPSFQGHRMIGFRPVREP